jgi:hypothetical protein
VPVANSWIHLNQHIHYIYVEICVGLCQTSEQPATLISIRLFGYHARKFLYVHSGISKKTILKNLQEDKDKSCRLLRNIVKLQSYGGAINKTTAFLNFHYSDNLVSLIPFPLLIFVSNNIGNSGA